MSRLTNHTSAYLRSAAEQPVDWHPWGPEAFARAAREGKPVLLDIGAVWCHWCHVMDRESYEDPELAVLLNSDWVCIKVDRDASPDVDARYQRAVQALTGQGGWPLTAFLTPEGNVFFGGTYFPPDDGHGRPGFRTLLTQLAALWKDKPTKLVEQATAIREGVAEAARDEVKPGPVAPDLIADATDGLARVFDFRYGGFGTQPKFPHPAALRLLLARWRDARQDWPREMVDRTLLAMARGGIHDHVGGGFHRYTVDARWRTPHFEKMLYDNAELLSAFCDALPNASAPAAAWYREAIAGIVHWTLGTMAHADGGYGASQDADVGLDDDGAFFTWTADEIGAACPEDLATVAVEHFGVEPSGRHVLYVAAEIDAGKRKAILAHLRASRAHRASPFVDRTLYVGWNALMVSAMLKAGAALDDAECTHHALRTLDRLFATMPMERGLLRHAEGAKGQALLEDQVYTAQAALDAFEHTGLRVWSERAATLMHLILEHFGTEGGALRDREAGDGTGLLDDVVIPVHDAPVPSANGIAADVLLRLAGHDPDGNWRATAERLLGGLGETLGQLGVHGGALLGAADRLLHPSTRVVVVADRDGEGETLWLAARRAWAPRRVLSRHAPDESADDLPAPVAAMLTAEHPRAYVCVGPACRAPARTPDELEQALLS